MTKPQHQGSLHDQLIELVQLANKSGLYDAADAVTRCREQIEQIAAWFEAQAAKERVLLDSDQVRPDAIERTHERWLVYKASAIAICQGDWKKKP